MLEMLTVISIIFFLLAMLAGIFLRQQKTVRVRATQQLLERIGLGLTRYYGELRCYPPDVGYGLATMNTRFGIVDAAGTRSVLYDPGALWRYLGREVTEYYSDKSVKRTLGPFVQFRPEELAAYDDPTYAYQSYYVVDAWNHQVGYVGNPRRVVHNRGAVDLYSAGADKKTASDDGGDHGAGGRPDQAYAGFPNDTAADMGEAANNGSLTLFKTNKTADDEKLGLDDINNWDPQN
jgi:type II secretory pathway pseudopilin PulG